MTAREYLNVPFGFRRCLGRLNTASVLAWDVTWEAGWTQVAWMPGQWWRIRGSN
jgi:hypothetical protein